MPENVRCTVNECTYWEQGDRCIAESILIALEHHAKRRDDGMEIGALSETATVTSTATNCQTFKPREQR